MGAKRLRGWLGAAIVACWFVVAPGTSFAQDAPTTTVGAAVAQVERQPESRRGDVEADREIRRVILVLTGVGLGMALVTLLYWRSSRPVEPELARLAAMGSRRWARADVDDRAELLDRRAPRSNHDRSTAAAVAPALPRLAVPETPPARVAASHVEDEAGVVPVVGAEVPADHLGAPEPDERVPTPAGLGRPRSIGAAGDGEPVGHTVGGEVDSPLEHEAVPETEAGAGSEVEVEVEVDAPIEAAVETDVDDADDTATVAP